MSWGKPFHYWAVRYLCHPRGVRIEKAETAKQACRLAFGNVEYKRHELNIGRLEAKDMGTQLKVIQSDSKRIALLNSEEGWFDPYAVQL